MMNLAPRLNAFSRQLLYSSKLGSRLSTRFLIYLGPRLSTRFLIYLGPRLSTRFLIYLGPRLSTRFLIYLGIVLICPSFADVNDECPLPSLYDRPETWKDRVRIRTLKNLDQFLNWSFGEKYKTYVLTDPVDEKKIEEDVLEMRSFEENYGYFSWKHPVVAKVTTTKEDLEMINCLLRTLYEQGKNRDYLQVAVAEVITKALAYHDLKIGQMVTIPIEVNGKLILERFIVERIFNLWKGMPAFGLVPEHHGIDSILLYRGTDFSLDSQRGWASLMSDLDIAGPGFSAFQRSQKEISYWVRSIKTQGKPARVMGFSLGGALAIYTFVYENQWLSNRGSFSICAPGVKEKVISEWELISPERQIGLTNFVNMGDVVSKVGKLCGNVYVLFTNKTYKPLMAHTMLMSCKPFFFKAKVDVGEENKSR